MSLSFRGWSRPITCPPNFEDGPQTLARLIFLDIPFRIFSATVSRVEFCFRIMGVFVAGLWGSFV